MAPEAVLADANGNVYIADQIGHRVVKIDSSGVMSVVLGTGVRGLAGYGKAATAATIQGPSGLAMDAAGNLYVSDRESGQIYKVDKQGIFTVIAGIAGTAVARYSGDGRPATDATLNAPRGMNFGPDGNLYIAETGGSRIRMIDMTTGKIFTVAGNGVAGYTGDGVKPVLTRLNAPEDVAFDSSGAMYIADTSNYRIRRVKYDLIETYIGRGTIISSTNDYAGQGLTNTALGFVGGISFDTDGTLYIADRGSTSVNSRIRKVLNADSTALSTASVYTVYTYTVPAHYSNQGNPCRLSVRNGVVYWGDTNSHAVYSFNMGFFAPTMKNMVSVIAGATNIGIGGPANEATLWNPSGLAVDSNSNLYVADDQKHQVFKVDAATGVLSVYAGTGARSNVTAAEARNAAPLPATGAAMNRPSQLAVDSANNLYIADYGNNRIRKVSASDGTFTTVAGGGSSRLDGIPAFLPALSAAESAQKLAALPPYAVLAGPSGVAVDATGNIYIADSLNHVIRKVDASDGTISTIAGQMQTTGAGGDGGLAINAFLNTPTQVAVDANGNVYFTEYPVHTVRVISGGYIYPVLGNTGSGSWENSTTRKSWTLRTYNPKGIAVDAKGNAWIAEYYYNTVRRYDPNTGLILNMCGANSNILTANDGPDVASYSAAAASISATLLGAPNAVAVDPNTGIAYVATTGAGLVRAIIPK